MAYFDGGEYAKLVSTDGFDIHTHNAKLFGIFDGKGDIDKKTRELAKSMMYTKLPMMPMKRHVYMTTI